MEDIQIRRAVREDGALHFGIGGVEDFGAEGFGLALQLKWRITCWAKIIDCTGVPRCDIKAWGFANWAEEIESAPGLGPDAGALRSACVAVEAFRGKMQIHAGITS